MAGKKLQVKSARAVSGDERGGGEKEKEKRRQRKWGGGRKKNPVISIKTDCQTRWGTIEEVGQSGWMGRDFDWANLNANQTLASEQDAFPKHSAAPLSCNSKCS